MLEMQLLKSELAKSNERKIGLIRAALGSELHYVTASQRPVLLDQIAELEAAIADLRGA